MKFEDLKAGQTLRGKITGTLYTVKYVGDEFFVFQIDGQPERIERSQHLDVYELYVPPIPVTAYVYFYISKNNGGRPVHRLCYDKTQLHQLRLQDGANYLLSEVTEIQTEIKAVS